MVQKSKDAIMKKLLNKYLNIKIPVNNNSLLVPYISKLRQCFETYGIHHYLCQEIGDKMDKTMSDYSESYPEVKKQARKYSMDLNHDTPKKKTKSQLKGREQVARDYYPPKGYPKNYPEF